MDKRALTLSIISQLEVELALHTEAALGSRDEATDEDSRAEDKYDMRSQSAAYLAAGQAMLTSEIAGAIAAWRALSLRVFGAGEGIAAGVLKASVHRELRKEGDGYVVELKERAA